MPGTETNSTRPSLRRRLLAGLLGYVLLLSVGVTIHGLVVNEHAEQLVWQSLLVAELDHLEERAALEPDYRWADTRNMTLYDSRQTSEIPAVLAKLSPGVHDEVLVDGHERVALVRQENDRRLILTLDISELEQRERDMALTVVGSALTLLLVLGLLAAWGANRLVTPLARIAQRIGDLRPDQQGQRLDLPDGATAELEVIAQAVNDYLARNDRFVERERLFIAMASHELRTPVAVIAGAAELALRSPEAPQPIRVLLNRIRGAARGVQELISLLLVLARDPARLGQLAEPIALERLVPEIVQDHEHLAGPKDLSITVDAAVPVGISGPPQIVRAAIGNLLRNAIENSDRGEIRIRVEPTATVVISDPGHGMSPEEIGAVYSRLARGDSTREGSGIGLDLIARLCEHLGWKLEMQSGGNRGTTAVLRFS